jgi:hypothetical protein
LAVPLEPDLLLVRKVASVKNIRKRVLVKRVIRHMYPRQILEFATVIIKIIVMAEIWKVEPWP